MLTRGEGGNNIPIEGPNGYEERQPHAHGNVHELLDRGNRIYSFRTAASDGRSDRLRVGIGRGLDTA